MNEHMNVRVSFYSVVRVLCSHFSLEKGVDDENTSCATTPPAIAISMQVTGGADLFIGFGGAPSLEHDGLTTCCCCLQNVQVTGGADLFIGFCGALSLEIDGPTICCCCLHNVQVTGGADLFVGFGGVVERTPVAAEADWYVYKYSQLIESLQRYTVGVAAVSAHTMYVLHYVFVCKTILVCCRGACTRSCCLQVHFQTFKCIHLLSCIHRHGTYSQFRLHVVDDS
jgi:hypothetical protein